MVNAQEWLDKEYPKEIRWETKEIHIRESLIGRIRIMSDVYLFRFST